MTIRLTGLFGIGLALCCCCPQRYAQVNSSITQSEGESSKNEGQVRVIEGWNIAVVGEWGNGRVVEWPLMEPIPSPREKVDSDWGFMVIGTKLGPKVVEWPSLTPIRDAEKKGEELDLDDLPPSPDSRWSK